MEERNYTMDNLRGFINNWWILLVVGIAIAVVGILVFRYPGESYMALGYTFAILMMVTGVAQMYLGFNLPRHMGRGWLIAGGAIEILLGILLIANPASMAVVLPFILGFWLLFRSLLLIGTASDMMAVGIKGPGWTIVLAIILMACAFMVLFYPIIGVGAIVVWIGLSFLIAGISMVVFSIHLASLRRHLR